MVKKKASQQSNAGLELGGISSEPKSTSTTTSLSGVVLVECPTGKIKPLGFAASNGDHTEVHVAKTQDLGTGPFWAMLMQAGYQAW